MTQRTFTADEVQKKFNALPEEIQDMLYSTDFTTIIQKVGEKNKLHYDQMGRLEMETRNVLLGFTDTPDFAAIIAKALDVEQNIATAITQDLNDLLFSKIRDTMKDAVAITPAKIPNPPAVTTPPMPEKSVVMPSAAKAPVPTVTTPAPVATPTTPTPSPTAAPSAPSVPEIIKPVGMPMMQHVDAMLSQPTVSLAPKPTVTPTPAPVALANAPVPVVDIKKSDAPTPPPIYKTDPYHEPVD
jgi:hypothetical protein